MRGKYKRRRVNIATLRGRHYAMDPNMSIDDPDIQAHLHNRPPFYIEHFTKGFVLERLGVPDRHQQKNDSFAAIYGKGHWIPSGKTRLATPIALSHLVGLDDLQNI